MADETHRNAAHLGQRTAKGLSLSYLRRSTGGAGRFTMMQYGLGMVREITFISYSGGVYM